MDQGANIGRILYYTYSSRSPYRLPLCSYYLCFQRRTFFRIVHQNPKPAVMVQEVVPANGLGGEGGGPIIGTPRGGGGGGGM